MATNFANEGTPIRYLQIRDQQKASKSHQTQTHRISSCLLETLHASWLAKGPPKGRKEGARPQKVRQTRASHTCE